MADPEFSLSGSFTRGGHGEVHGLLDEQVEVVDARNLLVFAMCERRDRDDERVERL